MWPNRYRQDNDPSRRSATPASAAVASSLDRFACNRASLPTPIDEGAGISGGFQDCDDSRHARPRPPQIAVPVASRQIEALSVEHPHDLGGGPQPQEALEDQPEPLLD